MTMINDGRLTDTKLGKGGKRSRVRTRLILLAELRALVGQHPAPQAAPQREAA
jgi:hypothetical protein